jgi:uncharacterized membrane protein YkvA (DUF1232 family)
MENRKGNTDKKGGSTIGSIIDKSSYYFKNPDKLNNILSEAFNKASVESDNKAIGKMSELLRTSLRMVRASFSGEYTGLSRVKLLFATAALVYAIAPKDLIPDNIPFLGAIDDVAALAWFIKSAHEEVVKFQEWEGTAITSATPAY